MTRGPGDAYGLGFGHGLGSGYGYGPGLGFDIEIGEGEATIGCQRLSIDEWLGDKGRQLADEHGVTDTAQVFLRAVLEKAR